MLVISRTNLFLQRYIETQQAAQYPVLEWLHDPDLSNVQGVPVKYWKLVLDDVVEMDQSEKDAVDADDLAKAKADRIDLFNGDTQQLIEQDGFEFPALSRQIFALDQPARLYLVELDVGAAGLVYPVVMTTKDGMTEQPLADGAAVGAFFKAACTAVRAQEDSGLSFLRRIAAATTVAEVDAIIDTRV